MVGDKLSTAYIGFPIGITITIIVLSYLTGKKLDKFDVGIIIGSWVTALGIIIIGEL